MPPHPRHQPDAHRIPAARHRARNVIGIDTVAGASEIWDVCGQDEVERLLPITRDESLPQEERLAARNRIVVGNMRLVMKIASYYAGEGATREDLISNGAIGLMSAIGRYDPTQAAFSNFATWHIKCQLRKYLAQSVRHVRIPAHLHWLRRQYQAAEWHLTTKLGRSPTPDEVRAELPPIGDVGWERLLGVMSFANMAPQLDEHEFSQEPDPADTAAVNDSIDTLNEYLKFVPKREREALILYFGHGKTLEEIAPILGVTRERVRQLKDMGLATIRAKALGWHGGSVAEARRFVREERRDDNETRKRRRLQKNQLTKPTPPSHTHIAHHAT